MCMIMFCCWKGEGSAMRRNVPGRRSQSTQDFVCALHKHRQAKGTIGNKFNWQAGSREPACRLQVKACRQPGTTSFFVNQGHRMDELMNPLVACTLGSWHHKTSICASTQHLRPIVACQHHAQYDVVRHCFI